MKVTCQHFDDRSERRADGLYDYIYKGRNFTFLDGLAELQFRLYDDEPDTAHLLRPMSWADASANHNLLDLALCHLRSTERVRVVEAYSPDTGAYASVTSAQLRLNWLDFEERVRNLTNDLVRGDGWLAVLVHPTAEELPERERRAPMSVDAYLGIDNILYFIQFETHGCSARGPGFWVRYSTDQAWVNFVAVLDQSTISGEMVREGCDRTVQIVRRSDWTLLKERLSESLQSLTDLVQQAVA